MSMIRRTLCRDTQDIHKSAIFNFTFHLVKELSGVKTSQLFSFFLDIYYRLLFRTRYDHQARQQVTDFFYQ
jgi:hypothetical protein